MLDAGLERYITRYVARVWWAQAITGLSAVTLIDEFKITKDIVMEYAHEKAEAAIAALTVESTDADIAHALAVYMMVGKHAPHVFKINHNGAAAPCPVKIDKVHGAKHCSVALRDPDDAYNWCVGALVRGYEVTAGTQRGAEVRSLAMTKSSIRHRAEMAVYRAKRAAAKAAGEPDPDDEIPF